MVLAGEDDQGDARRISPGEDLCFASLLFFTPLKQISFFVFYQLAYEHHKFTYVGILFRGRGRLRVLVRSCEGLGEVRWQGLCYDQEGYGQFSIFVRCSGGGRGHGGHVEYICYVHVY